MQKPKAEFDMTKPKPRPDKGFTLIEVLIGMALMGVAILGLTELFTLSVLQNRQADRIASATFLAQQEIDAVRNMTVDEISALAGVPIDELIDVNSDGVNDYRRITQILYNADIYDVRVTVFSAEHLTTAQDDLIALIADPEGRNKARAHIQTLVTRGGI